MTDDQQLVGWLATFLFLMAVWLVYRPYLSAVLFDAPKDPKPGGVVGSLTNPWDYIGQVPNAIGGAISGGVL